MVSFIATLRRTYLYIVATISLGLLAASTDFVFAWVVELLVPANSVNEIPLWSFAGIVVQGPVWAGHMFLATRYAVRDHTERRSPIRRLAHYASMTGGLLLIAGGVAGAIRSMVLLEGDGVLTNLVHVIIGVPLFLGYRSLLRTDQRLVGEHLWTGRLRRLQGALVASTSAVFALFAARELFTTVLDAGFGLQREVFERGILADAVGTLIVAVVVWVTYHRSITSGLLAGDGDARSKLLATYWLVVVTLAIGRALFAVAGIVKWVVDTIISSGPEDGPLTQHVASLVIFGVAWRLFRTPLHDHAETWRLTLDRVYRTIVTVIGLALGTLGIALLIGTLADFLAGSAVATDVADRIAYATVGLGTWVVWWRPPGNAHLTPDEARSRPRRFGIYVVLLGSALSLLSSGVYVVFAVLSLLVGEVSFPSTAVGGAIVAVITGGYHLTIIRTTLTDTPEPNSDTPEPNSDTPEPNSDTTNRPPLPTEKWGLVHRDGAGLTIVWFVSAEEAHAAQARHLGGWSVIMQLADAGLRVSPLAPAHIPDPSTPSADEGRTHPVE